MLPASIVAKAIHLCAIGLGGTGSPEAYAIVVHAGAVLRETPANEADAEATLRDLLARGADFEAGPLRINGREFATYGVTPATVFDACALARTDGARAASTVAGAATVSSVSALLRRTFAARITDTIRPMNASYGARYSWHKFGQAIDFVPEAGVNSITREQLRALMGSSGVRVIELLGPGDRGHSNHWHIAFARPGQTIDQPRPVEDDEDWLVGVVATEGSRPSADGAHAPAASPSGVRTAAAAPPQWDVFAAADWRASQGSGS